MARLTMRDLKPCSKCGCKVTQNEVINIRRLDKPRLHIVIVGCAGPRCYQAGVGRHSRKRKATQLAMQDWQKENEVTP